MSRFVVFLFLPVLATVHFAAMAQANAPTRQLVDYVRDCKRVGLNAVQIREDAAGAGWSAAAVDQAIEMVDSAAKAQAGEKPGAEARQVLEASSPAPFDIARASAPVPQAVATGTLKTRPAEPPPGGVEGEASRAMPMAVGRGTMDDYVIGAGDTLHIVVWHQPEASMPSVVVLPNGTITLPLLKEVVVAGLTRAQAERLIAEGLSKSIVAPDVTVAVAAVNSKKIYAIGAIKKEGTVAYTYSMTVMQAISEAGGLTDSAKKSKIYVLRNEDGREYRIPFDYSAVLKGQHMESNIPLVPGDTIVVPH